MKATHTPPRVGTTCGKRLGDGDSVDMCRWKGRNGLLSCGLDFRFGIGVTVGGGRYISGEGSEVLFLVVLNIIFLCHALNFMARWFTFLSMILVMIVQFRSTDR